MSAVSSASSSSTPLIGYIVDGTEEVAPTSNQADQVQAQEVEGSSEQVQAEEVEDSSDSNSTFFAGYTEEQQKQFWKNERQQFNSMLSASAEGQKEAQDRFAESFQA